MINLLYMKVKGNILWDLNHIESDCPVFVKCKIAKFGLGDQLERHIYALYLAKLIGATIIGDGFLSGGFGMNRQEHKGSDEYRNIATDMFGIDIRFNEETVRKMYPNLTDVQMTYDAVLTTAISTVKPKYCYSIINSEITSCGGHWCHLMRPFLGLTETLPVLRRNKAMQICADLADKRSKTHVASTTPHSEVYNKLKNNQDLENKVLKVHWHVRTGLRCNDLAYFQSVFDLLQQIFTGIPFTLTFHSSDPLPLVRELFPNSIFKHEETLKHTICAFLNSDVVITSGSSFSLFVTAIGRQSDTHPVILEERI